MRAVALARDCRRLVLAPRRFAALWAGAPDTGTGVTFAHARAALFPTPLSPPRGLARGLHRSRSRVRSTDPASGDDRLPHRGPRPRARAALPAGAAPDRLAERASRRIRRSSLNR